MGKEDYICEDCGAIIGEVEYTMFDAMCEVCYMQLHDEPIKQTSDSSLNY
ncbi:MAG: hypothetical protein WD267_03650 [Balneolales bacterium]